MWAKPTVEDFPFSERIIQAHRNTYLLKVWGDQYPDSRKAGVLPGTESGESKYGSNKFAFIHIQTNF
jgi:hypothetical protein